MFPDLRIARNFKDSWTKTTAIWNEAMDPSLKYTLVEYMKEQPFALFNDDGTSDCGIKNWTLNVSVSLMATVRSLLS